MICPDCPAADQIDLMPEDVLRSMAREDIVGSIYPSVKINQYINIAVGPADLRAERAEYGRLGERTLREQVKLMLPKNPDGFRGYTWTSVRSSDRHEMLIFLQRKIPPSGDKEFNS